MVIIKEFREKGFLQEANRLFFHPLGLALSVDIDDDGNERLFGVWDFRHDPEGIIFKEGTIDIDKAEHVKQLKASKLMVREVLLGDTIQSAVVPKGFINNE